MNLSGRKVLLTGGSGFLGRVIKRKLEERGATVIAPTTQDCDLRLSDSTTIYVNNAHPDVIIHSAAFYGGIWLNKLYPADVYRFNMLMQTNIIEAARLAKVEKFVGVGTACSYPGSITGSLHEDDLWIGEVHESVRCYGAVKKMMGIQLEAYWRQYRLNGCVGMLANLYGEWDSYNPDRSHVVAALIRKFVEAKMNESPWVTVWGTGVARREFLYVEDAAEGIVRLVETETEPGFVVNIGTGIGTSIKELAESIREISGYQGGLTWDSSKPGGQSEKVFNVRLMRDTLLWRPGTSLDRGLKKTISWFEENYREAIKRP